MRLERVRRRWDRSEECEERPTVEDREEGWGRRMVRAKRHSYANSPSILKSSTTLSYLASDSWESQKR